MNEQERRRLVQDYLDRLVDELDDAPRAARRELVEDVRGHIEDAWAASPEKSQAALLNVFDRLGTPENVAREMRERLGAGLSPTRDGPGLLELAAIVLTGLFWPIGVLLAWLSPRWRTCDKVISTLIPTLGFALVVTMSLYASSAMTAAPAVTSVAVQTSGEATAENQPAAGTDDPSAVNNVAPPGSTTSLAKTVQAILARLLVFYGLLGAPFTSAFYLALRIRSRYRRAARTMLAVVGVTVAASFAVLVALSLV